MYRRNCNYHPVNKGFIDEISYLRSHNRFKSTSQKLIKYYTDHHDVDEELRTFTRQGGYWYYENLVGVVDRFMFDSSSYAAVDIASVQKK